MLSFAEARRLISTLPLELRIESVPLLEAGGRILARPVKAPWALPRFDNSSMDGFAVRADGLRDATAEKPVRFPIAGESAAGRPFDQPIAAGTAIRISTGARLPEGADAIVPIEKVSTESRAKENASPVCSLRPGDLGEAEEDAVFSASAVAGRFIRRRGEDVAEGAPLFEAGTRLDPPKLAFLAMFNLPALDVYARPRVAILSSGDEVRLHGEALRETDVVGVNIYYLERELGDFGCETRLFGIAPDRLDAYRELLRQALGWADLVVSTAGVSVGEHDVVGRAVADLGGEVLFWRVSIRPGKPTLAARFGKRAYFALPGNPVAVCCNTEILVKPFLREKLGARPSDIPLEQVRLAEACPRDGLRLFFVYARVEIENGLPVGRALPHQSSGNLFNPAQANALLVVDPGTEAVPAGTLVPAIRLTPGR